MCRRATSSNSPARRNAARNASADERADAAGRSDRRNGRPAREQGRGAVDDRRHEVWRVAAASRGHTPAPRTQMVDVWSGDDGIKANIGANGETEDETEARVRRPRSGQRCDEGPLKIQTCESGVCIFNGPSSHRGPAVPAGRRTPSLLRSVLRLRRYLLLSVVCAGCVISVQRGHL